MKNLTEEQFKTLGELADTLKGMCKYNYKPILVLKHCDICIHQKIISGNLIQMNIMTNCELNLNVDSCSDAFKLLPILEPW